MKYHSQNNKSEFTIIAETGDQFIDFSPYVASINNKGIIAFQAESANGNTGIYTGDGVSLNTVIDSAGTDFKYFYSHPDINDKDEYCFYAELNSGSQEIFLYKNNETVSLAETDAIFKSIGPLGPEMNEKDAVAFRADMNSGYKGIFIFNSYGVSKIADTEFMFENFFGLPVINQKGTVLFRAKMKNNIDCICRSINSSLEVFTNENTEFADFGRFTDTNNLGKVVFNAVKKNGTSGIYTLFNGEITAEVETENGFELLRTALINNSSNIVFYGITKEGKEGLFKGNDPSVDLIISLNDNLFDSTVVELAFNPVSMNDKDQIALRMKLENNHQLILRADLF